MFFDWSKWEELKLERRNTLQIFITGKCNLNCRGCFARNAMKKQCKHMSETEYLQVISNFIEEGGKQVNILGGEPLLHPDLSTFLRYNNYNDIKTTIYTNGYFLHRYNEDQFHGAKLRVSICSEDMKVKCYKYLSHTPIRFDANFMVSKETTVQNLLDCAYYVEENCNTKVFFIFSMLELDNPNKEFFEATSNTMNSLEYKQLVHSFMNKYTGNLDIDISKRGVFESTTTLPDTKCRFANYFIGGEIIQCPYDVINCNFQDGYEFGVRQCQHNNTCLMSKIKYKRK